MVYTCWFGHPQSNLALWFREGSGADCGYKQRESNPKILPIHPSFQFDGWNPSISALLKVMTAKGGTVWWLRVTIIGGAMPVLKHGKCCKVMPCQCSNMAAILGNDCLGWQVRHCFQPGVLLNHCAAFPEPHRPLHHPKTTAQELRRNPVADSWFPPPPQLEVWCTQLSQSCRSVQQSYTTGQIFVGMAIPDCKVCLLALTT